MCIHPNTVLDEFKGIFDLTPFRGHFGLKTFDFTVDATFLLAFLVDRYQTWYVQKLAILLLKQLFS